MSQALRQSEIFSGADWKVIYRAFTQVNFNASDPASINRALREYIQINYPEDFNDWIESQEFIFIIDLLSWLAGTLAFKTDINARENFLETAESRESILRLARFLSYNPRRNQPARGLLKIVEIQTDDDVIDGYGVNLSNTAVQWNNSDDPDWYERFTLIMNNAFVQNNQFGQPLKAATIGGARTQLYRINGKTSQINAGFTAQAGGDRMDFEICNGDFDETQGFFERTPNPDAAFHLFHRTDGAGNASPNSGFFAHFKQGRMSRQTINVPVPVENKLIDIDVSNINQSDVWVQTVSDAGAITTEWSKVPAIVSENTTFNSLPPTVRNIFSVVTRDDDRISIRFSDGRFGAAPVGNIRVWYRVSNGQRYTIRPQDIDRVTIPVPYVNRRGIPRTLLVTFSLQETVTNSTPRETDEQIRRRAPTVYATQNRMVSGEDYNTFPLQSNLAVKMKAVNRIYSGHSRFIDLNDPTGNYQDTNVFSDDGMFYKEFDDYSVEVPLSLSRTPAEMVAIYIQPALRRQSTSNYAIEAMMRPTTAIPEVPSDMEIRPTTSSSISGTGWFANVGSSHAIRPTLKPGALVALKPDGREWLSIVDIDDGDITVQPSAGRKGVTFSKPVPATVGVERIIPRFNSTLTSSALADIEQKLLDNTSFTILYEFATGTWMIGPPALTTDEAITSTTIKIMTVDYVSSDLWRITTAGLRYIFESQGNVQWYFDGAKAVDGNTGLQKQDLVRVMSVNEDINLGTGRSLDRPFDLSITNLIHYTDGYAEPLRVGVAFIDSDEDGVPDQPDTFARVVADSNAVSPESKYLFWARNAEGRFLPYYTMTVYETSTRRLAATPPIGTVAFQLPDSTSIADGTANNFFEMTTSGWSPVDGLMTSKAYRFALGRGPNVAIDWYTADESKTPAQYPINFQWKHYAPSDHRIDPSKTNIIDIFVLTSEYDYVTRQWVANGAKKADLPLPPSELDLRIALSEFNNYKMFSDEIVWRPVQYKFLFGAEEDLSAQFKVVKLENTTLSDGEIKSRVIRAVNDYFNVQMWDFGETFYYTELAAYIHQQLAGVIGSVVVVPRKSSSSFGDGFEVRCRSDEIFLSTAQVNDVVIINSNTASNLKIRKWQ
jgi:hypothetical protein